MTAGPLPFEAARAWIAQDPDPETRAELQAIVDRAEHADAAAGAELSARFASSLTFGTAGLRAELGAGPSRMNRVVVAQAAAGLGQFLIDSGRARSVVVGYDGRKNSDVFARDTAEILTGLGIAVTLLPEALPTPVLAFAVRHLDAGAGVMVTASHNPPRDNGYKVYLGGADGGSQIVPPSDADIAAAIEGVAAGDIRDLRRSDAYAIADDTVVAAYVDATAALTARPVLAPDQQPTVVYTAMHGVGWSTAQRVFDACGFRTPEVVREQISADADFPTVAFPNPEEPGAMDLAIALAIDIGADIVVANDPDADRLAVAIPHENGTYRKLSGNEVGWLLGWRAAERAVAHRAVGGPVPALAASLVSSPALARVADAYGLRYRETLTGFKWVSRVPDLIFGYEEALGYLVAPGVVHDKDGISAAADLLALACELAADGRTLSDRLEEFADRFGAYASGQVAVRVQEQARIGEIMRVLRTDFPEELGGLPVEAVTDYQNADTGLPAADILRVDVAGGARVVVRPSGTEPKVKVYIDVPARTLGEARSVVDRLADAVRPLVS